MNIVIQQMLLNSVGTMFSFGLTCDVVGLSCCQLLLTIDLELMILFADPLVFNIQLFHDGDLPGGSCFHDSDENSEKGLCAVQQR